MVLRLDPAIPLVWRDPHTLQFGVDPAVTVLTDVAPAVEHLIAVLAAGVSRSGYRMMADVRRVPRSEADALLTALAPCLLPETEAAPESETAAGGSVVLGGGEVALGLARLLDDAGLRLRDRRRAPRLAVLVADRVVRPADHRGWLRRDIPHLPVVVGDTAITVGPLVLPGASACLHCAALHRRDDDSAWPAIAAQLAAHPAPARHPLREAAALALAARVVATALDGHARTVAGREWRVAGDGSELSERAIALHPECRCAAPPGSDWAPADENGAPPPTSAARASAAHA